ncbi:unnamed protein product [Lymnaea stagnalis]|uniref:G-protein coupled receptors family 1 profile domain-containing protein n=1 Tax=Lymnaea stagnalis TaxID=6523 RepID=A0AAV2IH94_LYMST
MASQSVDTLLTDEQYAVIMGLYSSVGTVLSVFGLVTNAVNVKTFVAMGADDGVTVAFLFLSSAEFVCFLAALGQELAMIFWVTEMTSKYKIVFDFHPMIFNNFFSNARNCFFDIPVLITLYLAVAKCMCVIRPLHFKNMFSVKRTLWVMTGISVFAVLSYLPIPASAGVTWQFDKNINRSRPMFWTSEHRNIIKNVVLNARDSFPSIVSEIVILVCIYLMSKSLGRAAKFRASTRSGAIVEKTANPYRATTATVAKVDTKLKGAELQVIKQVVVISAIYIVGNTPKIIIFMVLYIVPDLSFGNRYQYVYIVIMNTRELIEMFTSAVNIVIYYTYNSKFRRYCKC